MEIWINNTVINLFRVFTKIKAQIMNAPSFCKKLKIVQIVKITNKWKIDVLDLPLLLALSSDFIDAKPDYLEHVQLYAFLLTVHNRGWECNDRKSPLCPDSHVNYLVMRKYILALPISKFHDNTIAREPSAGILQFILCLILIYPYATGQTWIQVKLGCPMPN